MSFKDNPGQLCPVCTDINLDDAFDAHHFAGLAPYNSKDIPDWTPYIRIIHTFSLSQVAESGYFCALCSLLKKVATRVQDHRFGIPRSSIFPPSHQPSTPSPSDGEGYTLAAISAESAYKIPNLNKEDGDKPSRAPSVLLLVIKGSNTLERLAFDARASLRTSISGAVIDQAVAHGKEHGTIISQISKDVYQDDSPMHLRLVNPDRLDYTQIKSWITRCTETHTACTNEGGYVPGMKVIDCATRKIVKPKDGTRYVALSYVWGKGAPEQYDYPSLPVDLPLVIEDAIIVCKRLGVPYIWIDRYCIWQEDPIHKMGQINRMDEIYGNALFTLAAAAGNGSQYPLPGVGLPRHQGPQVFEHAGQHTLVADYGYGFQRVRLEKSKWFTRGWTFQELALSPRVLLFTDYRVSFQCLSWECLEHLSSPISLQDGMRSSTTQNDLYTRDGIKTLIFAYSKRELSFASDSLNAIRGILRAWSHNNDGWGHIMGVPITLPEQGIGTDRAQMLALWSGLTWSLGFGHLRKGVRREGFPTWSWLGIQGQLEVGNSEFMQPSGASITEKSLIDGTASLEGIDGTLWNWSDYVVSDSFQSKGDSVVALHLEGWCFKVGPFTRVKVDTRNLFCLKVGEEADPGIIRFYPDLGIATPAEGLEREYEAISPYALEETRSALVIERTADGVRRVGILSMTIWGIDQAGKLYPKGLCDISKTLGGAERKTVRIL